MSERIRLDGTTVNAPDALALAQFHAEITDGVATGTSHWAAVTGSNGCIPVQPNSDHCLVYADPAGHPFCLSTWDSQGLVDAHAG